MGPRQSLPLSGDSCCRHACPAQASMCWAPQDDFSADVCCCSRCTQGSADCYKQCICVTVVCRPCTVCPAAGGAVRSRATCCGRPWSFHCFAAGPLLKPLAEICRSWVSATACYKLKISMRLSQQCPPAAVVLLLCTIAASAGSAARACCYFFFVAAAPPAPCVLWKGVTPVMAV